MTMSYCIQIGDVLTESQKNEIEQGIYSTFETVNKIYNIWNKESEISKLNSSAADTWIKISPALYKLLVLTDQMVKETNGLFDPTITPLQSLWKRYLIQNKMPPQDEIDIIKPSIGWNNIMLKDCLFLKKHINTEIDLGGIAKGYCVDLLIDMLKKLEIRNGYVEWGGEIAAIGMHPEKRAWRVFISHLEDTNPSHAIDIIELKDQAVATSGDYLQQWKLRDDHSNKTTIFTHLMHPKRLMPLELTEDNICSVTVVADRCYKADAYATALMLQDDVEGAKKWVKQMQIKSLAIDAWIVQRN